MKLIKLPFTLQMDDWAQEEAEHAWFAAKKLKLSGAFMPRGPRWKAARIGYLRWDSTASRWVVQLIMHNGDKLGMYYSRFKVSCLQGNEDIEGYVVHHIDRDTENDYYQNLELLTPEEHMAEHWEELRQDWQHGTTYGYREKECRCQDCTAAYTAHLAQEREKDALRRQQPEYKEVRKPYEAEYYERNKEKIKAYQREHEAIVRAMPKEQRATMGRPIKHGTVYAYRTRGCKCAECSAAMQTKWNADYAKKQEKAELEAARMLAKAASK